MRGRVSRESFTRPSTFNLLTWYKVNMKRLTVKLIPDTEQGGFTARVPDIPAYGEGVTEDEAIADLREALLAYVEEFGVEDAMARLNQPTALRPLDLELEDPIHA